MSAIKDCLKMFVDVFKNERAFQNDYVITLRYCYQNKNIFAGGHLKMVAIRRKHFKIIIDRLKMFLVDSNKEGEFQNDFVDVQREI